LLKLGSQRMIGKRCALYRPRPGNRLFKADVGLCLRQADRLRRSETIAPVRDERLCDVCRFVSQLPWTASTRVSSRFAPAVRITRSPWATGKGQCGKV